MGAYCNRKQTGEPRESDRVTAWGGAGLMLSYWCSARCRFCYVSAGPDHPYWADSQRVVSWWQGLERIANRRDRHAKIHITGGDPFGRPELLFAVLREARDAGLPPAEKVETNAFWATDDGVVRRHLTTLKSLGVQQIVTDADVFHQEFVKLENVTRLVNIAREVLGEKGVRVRWWDFYHRYADTDFDVGDLSGDDLADLQADALAAGRDRLTGRAAFLAAERLQGRPAETFRDQPCEKAILKSKHVHIDPHGHVFPGVCCGLVFGNAVNEPLEDIYEWLRQNGPTGPVFTALVNQGPAALIDLANRYGFEPFKNGYITKCQLCCHVRHTLYHVGQCRKWIGPGECY